MNKIQQLIKKYPQSKNDIIHELQHQDSLWIAYSPVTKNHYTDFYKGISTAYIFSEEDYCNSYKKYLSAKKINIEPMENLIEKRITLFSDFIRCGIEQIIVDNGQTFVILTLPDIINSPDFSSLPEEERPLTNPSLVMHTNMFFQNISAGNTESSIENDMMKDIYEAKYLIPLLPEDRVSEDIVIKQFNTGTAILNIPAVKFGTDRSCIPVFTDWLELSKLDTKNMFAGNIVSFDDIDKICSYGEVVTINPLGFNMIIDSTTIASIKSRFSTQYEQTAAFAQENYEQANVPAQENYEKTNVSAQENYEQANVPAQENYEQTNVSAQENYEQANVPAQENYEQTNVPTQENYEQTNVPTQENYEQANVPAQENFDQIATPDQNVPEQKQSLPKHQEINLTFFELQSVPDVLIHKLIELFDMTEGIRNVYLKGFIQNDRSGYLCVVDFEGTDPEVFQKIAQETVPLTGGVPLSFVKYDSNIGRTAAEGAYPFYQGTTF